MQKCTILLCCIQPLLWRHQLTNKLKQVKETENLIVLETLSRIVKTSLFWAIEIISLILNGFFPSLLSKKGKKKWRKLEIRFKERIGGFRWRLLMCLSRGALCASRDPVSCQRSGLVSSKCVWILTFTTILNPRSLSRINAGPLTLLRWWSDDLDWVGVYGGVDKKGILAL